MTWLTLSGALALTTAAFAQAVPAPEIAGQDLAVEPVEVLDLDLERYNRLTVPVTIMGRGPYRFLIDTGAQATVLSRDLADELELHDRESATLVAMNSRRVVETIFVPDVQVGSRNFMIRTAPLLEGQHIGGADGILGLDSLQDQRVVLDFVENTIAVANGEDKGGRSGYEIVVRARERLGQLIIASAQLDGVRTAVVIDTGAQGSVGNYALRDRLRRARDAGPSTMTDVNGVELLGDMKITRNLEMGRAQLRNLPIVFTDSPIFHALGLDDQPALVLGMTELRLFDRVAIDFEKRRVLFDVPRGNRVPSSSDFNRFGLN